MVQSAALILAPREPTGEERDPVQEAATLVTQSLEDFRLAERVGRALCATGYGPLRYLAVTVHARLVVLSGPVPTYYLKQLAQETALAVPGTRQVRNDLDVLRSS